MQGLVDRGAGGRRGVRDDLRRAAAGQRAGGGPRVVELAAVAQAGPGLPGQRRPEDGDADGARSAVATLATDPQDVTALELPWLDLTLQVYAVTLRRPARAATEFVATLTRADNTARTTS